MERISKWAPSRGFMVCMWFMIFVILSFTSTYLPKKKSWDLEPAATKKGFLSFYNGLIHFSFFEQSCQNRGSFFFHGKLPMGMLEGSEDVDSNRDSNQTFFTFIASNDYKYMNSAKSFWSLSKSKYSNPNESFPQILEG